MNNSLVTLESWVADKASSVRGTARQQILFFQKDWIEGHYNNPLLFPLEAPYESWDENFEWFQAVDSFQASDQAPVNNKGVLLDGESIVFDPAVGDANLETVILDQPSPQIHDPDPPEVEPFPIPIESDELDDLETLVLEDVEKSADKKRKKKEKPKPSVKPSLQDGESHVVSEKSAAAKPASSQKEKPVVKKEDSKPKKKKDQPVDEMKLDFSDVE